jgi:hypothetical protein
VASASNEPQDERGPANGSTGPSALQQIVTASDGVPVPPTPTRR